MLTIQERSISISTHTILKVIATLLILSFLWAVRDIIALVFAALILAALMNPFAQWAKSYHIPKGVSVIVFYVLFVGGLLLAFALVLPDLVEQTGKLSNTVGKSWQVLSSGIESLRHVSEEYGLTKNLEAGVATLQEQISSILPKLFRTLTGLFGGIAGLAVVLVMAFYMVVQEEEALQWLRNIVPEEYQKFTADLLQGVQVKFGRWLIGQLALSQSPPLALLTIILFVVVQQTENHILVPKVMQKAVGINPVLSIVALLVGAKLFGIPGAILAIPVTTACSVAIMEVYKFQRTRQGSSS